MIVSHATLPTGDAMSPTTGSGFGAAATSDTVRSGVAAGAAGVASVSVG